VSPTLLVFPLAKVAYVVDEVVVLPGSTKPTLLNVWEVIRVPVGAKFPYTLGKVCAVAWMRDGLGQAEFRVDIVDEASNSVIWRTPTLIVSFPNRLKSRLIVTRMLHVVFPYPGVYLLEFFCDNQFMDDQRIEIL
jgi:hypothetical protein